MPIPLSSKSGGFNPTELECQQLIANINKHKQTTQHKHQQHHQQLQSNSNGNTLEVPPSLSSSDSSPSPVGPLEEVLELVFEDLLLELQFDIVVSAHKLSHTRLYLPLAPLNVDWFGLANSKKIPERSFKCEACGQKSGSSKYAAHLEKCTGKGGRISSRRGRGANSSTTPTPMAQQNASHASNASAAASSSVASAVAAPVTLSRAHWEDDAEIIAAASSRGSSAAAGKALSSSPTAASPARSESPFTNVNSSHHRSSFDSSPYSGSPSVGGPSPTYTDDSSSGWPASLPPMSASSVDSQKRRGEESSKSTGENKKRRTRGDDFWVGPLPTILPTCIADGGLPFVVNPIDIPLLPANVSEPTPEQVTDMLTRICGVPSNVTNKMCSNKIQCSMHPEEDKQATRAKIQDGRRQLTQIKHAMTSNVCAQRGSIHLDRFVASHSAFELTIVHFFVPTACVFSRRSYQACGGIKETRSASAKPSQSQPAHCNGHRLKRKKEELYAYNRQMIRRISLYSWGILQYPLRCH